MSVFIYFDIGICCWSVFGSVLYSPGTVASKHPYITMFKGSGGVSFGKSAVECRENLLFSDEKENGVW